MIGLEIHVRQLLRNWTVVALAVAAMLDRFSEKIPFRWQSVIVWGGLRGALALALALSLPSTFPYREQILDLTFGVVIFSIVVQGLTIKPLLNLLKLSSDQNPITK